MLLHKPALEKFDADIDVFWIQVFVEIRPLHQLDVLLAAHFHLKGVVPHAHVRRVTLPHQGAVVILECGNQLQCQSTRRLTIDHIKSPRQPSGRWSPGGWVSLLSSPTTHSPRRNPIWILSHSSDSSHCGQCELCSMTTMRPLRR